VPSGIEWWSLANMGRSMVEQAEVLVPLYRAVYARDGGDDVKANSSFEQALAAARLASDHQRDFLEATVFGNWKKRDESIAAFMRYIGHGGAQSGFIGVLAQLMSTIGRAQGQTEKRIHQERTNEQAFTFMVLAKAYECAKPYLEALEKSAGKDWWKRSTQPWKSLSDCAESHEGLALNERGELLTALAYYDKAIAQLEARRSLLTRDELKTALASDKGAQYWYFQAARAALNAGDKASAFRYIESAGLARCWTCWRQRIPVRRNPSLPTALCESGADSMLTWSCGAACWHKPAAKVLRTPVKSQRLQHKSQLTKKS
jgi:tetratricopeptide (TPR) repeat protein